MAGRILAAVSRAICGHLSARSAGGSLPSSFQLFRLGRNQSADGDFVVDDDTLAQLAHAQRVIGRERVPIGFEHNIDPGSPEYNRTQEPRPTAGTARVAVKPGAVIIDEIQWSEEGQRYYDCYEDLSPTVLYDQGTRRIQALMSVSLVRTGSVYGLTTENAATAMLSAGLASGACDLSRLAASRRGGRAVVELRGLARVIAANERDNAQSARLSASHLAPKTKFEDPPLRGLARTVAALDAINAKDREREARLSAGVPVLDSNLRGMARVIAANERDNARRH